MFGFTRKKSALPSTIVIEGIDSLTNGQLTVDTIWQPSGMITNLGAVISKAFVSSDDPIDAALQQYVISHAMSLPQFEPSYSISFNSDSGVSGNIWHHGEHYVPALKGMPEKILDYCDLSDNERESIVAQFHALSAAGAIVLAVASGILPYPMKKITDLKHNDKLAFVGFVGLRITPATDARTLITKPSTYLVTGQSPEATLALVTQLGIDENAAAIYDARRLDVMNEDEVNTVVGSVKVFARATSGNKARILHALKAQDKTVAHVKSSDDLRKLLAN